MLRASLVLAVMLALLAALPVSAPAHFGSTPADSAQKRKKAKKCKKGKVRVTVGKSRTCRPLKKVFPRPKAGDPRQLVAQSVLRKDWSKLRTRRGKRLPSLPKLIRRAGPRAPALLAKATKRGLARLDALELRAAGASRARVAQASRDCAVNSGGARKQDTFTTTSGGTSASVTATLGPEGAGLVMELSGKGMSVKLDMDMGLCDPNEVEAPQCPTAVGRLQGEIRYKLRVGVEVRRGAEEVWSQAVDVTRRTKLDGWNEVDAKLERLDVDDVETSNITLGGSARGFPPISIKTKIVRRTQVDMRTGSYDPGRSQVDVTIDTEGLSGPDRSDAESEAERRGQADADGQFRAVVDKSIDGYRNREAGWQQAPNPCAEMRFSPASDSLTLRGGAAGSFTATAIAKTDGSPSELDARLSEMQNAQFSPLRAGGGQARFDYSDVVGIAPPGSKVRVKVSATSKAGVAEGIWEQKLEPPFEINRISGNFSGSHTQPVGSRTARITWVGGATFMRATPPGVPGAVGTYILSAGQATFTYSGGTITAHAACDMRGTETVDLFQDGGGSIGVTPVDDARPFAQGPHDYGGDVSVGPEPRVTLTMENCAPGAESEEGKTYEYPLGFPPLDTGDAPQRSPDGTQYSGSHSISGSGITTSWSWTLVGDKASP